jgi:signal transduction histidine kinase
MENGEYRIERVQIAIQRILDKVSQFISFSREADNHTFCVDPVADTKTMLVDGPLLVRVLFNMVKNGLEATPRGETVRLWYDDTFGDHRFKVWNPGKIDDDIARHIFQRYYSTKRGQGRGLGTYSMKLLGERYLGGSVRFETGDQGTTFEISLRK